MYTCPVCGYGGLNEPAYDDVGGGSLEYCECCGFQFGVHDDDDEITHEEWRENWVADGMPWAIEEIEKPPYWNPKAQLFRIGVRVE